MQSFLRVTPLRAMGATATAVAFAVAAQATNQTQGKTMTWQTDIIKQRNDLHQETCKAQFNALTPQEHLELQRWKQRWSEANRMVEQKMISVRTLYPETSGEVPLSALAR
eukprot:TRINITY_DN259_c0_g1_i1.p3 TRINITY_DN259_c0_g1~~TRINITY_DN259_c0_g1_i1.p3  ORF type:complete len:110 (+),score=29.60 TRINITY_DN259_c0_g1_i1:204-533(+)